MVLVYGIIIGMGLNMANEQWFKAMRAMGRAAREVVRKEIVGLYGEKWWEEHQDELFPRGRLQGRCKHCGSWVDIEE